MRSFLNCNGMLVMLVLTVISLPLRAGEHDDLSCFHNGFSDDLLTSPVTNATWTCGAFPTAFSDQEGDFDSDMIYDRFGNKYEPRDVAIPKNEECFVCE